MYATGNVQNALLAMVQIISYPGGILAILHEPGTGSESELKQWIQAIV